MRAGLLALAVFLAPGPLLAARPLRVLSFNAAGLPVVHRGWSRRRAAIIERLKASSYGIVALQEVWRDSDADAFIRDAGFPHAARGGDGFIGNGLLILSRFPILESSHETFEAYPPALHKGLTQGEAWCSKGVLFARIEAPGGTLDVYDIHLVADYPADDYPTIRLAQGFEAFEAVRRRSAGRPLLVMGDLNTAPGEPEYRGITRLFGLADACMDSGRDGCGTTSRRSGRVDHILTLPGVSVFGAGLDFTAPLPGGKDLPYSDHKAVAASLGEGLFTARFSPRAAGGLDGLVRRFDGFIARLEARSRRRSWLPLYGAVHLAAYRRLVRPLLSIRERAATAAIMAGTRSAPRSYE